MTGSLLMLAAIVADGLKAGTFDLVDGPTSASRWLFLGFMLAFVIKAPLFPFHGGSRTPTARRRRRWPRSCRA